jgi:oligopeptide/dipeptide ABC transporter ATP-binding protein
VTGTGMSPLLDVRDLHKHFPAPRRGVGTVRAVDGVSFTVEAGEALGLVGESGSGKSTVARTVMRLYRPTDGGITFAGHDITRLGRRAMRPLWREMQMVYQDPYSSLDPRMTVAELVGEPLRIHRRHAPADRRGRVVELLELVGLDPSFAHRYPHEFSGGQRQRIGIARALALDPRLLILDEPVSALDVSVQAQVLNLLRSIQRRLSLAFLFVSHDLAVVRHVSHRVAVMYLGRIVELADVDAIYSAPAHPYTRTLLAAVPAQHPADRGRRSRRLPDGDRPDAGAPVSGCRFRDRCPVATPICAEVDPPEREIGPGHVAACHHPHVPLPDADTR